MFCGKAGEAEGEGEGALEGEVVVKVPGKLVGEASSCWGEATTGCSGGEVDMMMEEKEGSLVRTLVSAEDASTSSALLTFAFTLCVSRVETEEVLLSSPWLRKSGVGEGAEWKEDDSRRGLFDPCVGR